MTTVSFVVAPSVRQIQAERYPSVLGGDPPIDIPVLAGVASQALTPSGVDWCWQFTEQSSSGGFSRFCIVPNSGSTLDYDALVDVDPGTLAVAGASPAAAWTTGLATETTNRIAGDIAPLTAAAVTQGLYSRTIPTHAALGGTSFIPLALDPSVSGRIWGVRAGTTFGKIMWSDDHGTSATIATDLPLSGTAGSGSMKFGSSYVFLTQIGSGARGASLWRSPLPAANGSGLVWTKIFDLASPPGGITSGDNSTFKVGILAVNGANVYLGEYTATGTPSTGGPSLYYSSDSGTTWFKRKTWANAKHVHDVRVINGLPWASLGDPTAGFTDIGVWAATDSAATTWVQQTLFGEGVGGNTFYPIGFIPITVNGAPLIACESDGAKNLGPLFLSTQTVSAVPARCLVEVCKMPIGIWGTMRCLTYTSEGNLMWLHTGEGGALSATDSVCIAKGPHFSAVVILETVASSGGPWLSGANTREPLEDGQYIWIGNSRIRKEVFIGQ